MSHLSTLRVFVTLMLSALLAPVVAAQSADHVDLRQGRITGPTVPDSGVRVYRGLPFAAPPVGDLRWRPPQPVEPWEGVREATTFSAGCVQNLQRSRPPWTEVYMHQGDVSEDCLYLNVWTPAQSDEANLPVFVYIHGGGFNEGSGSVEIYDGEALASNGLVVVTLNYRLGVFGFLAHPELTAESEHGASGNYGLLDQVAALEWVRENIAAFGGDPDNVTVAGQSAGAMSVYLLTASPLAEGLFDRAIVQSGPGGLASFGLSSSALLARPLAEGEESGVAFAESKGASSLAALRALTPAELMARPESGPPPRFGSVVDGYFLPDNVSAVYAAGEQNDVPLLTGFNADEGSAFPGYGQASVEAFEASARELYGDAADRYLELYAAATDEEAGEASKQRLRDLGAVALTRLAAERAETAETDAYLYYFERGIPWPEHPNFGSFHSGELPYTFGNLHLLPRPWEPVDHTLTEAATAYWVNFARRGDPNGDGLPTWTPFGEAPHEMLVFGDPIEMRKMPDDDDRRAFHDEQLAQD